MADVIYTGKNLATKLPTDSGNAMQGLANFVAKAEETKFNVFQKNKDAFMKMTDVDPVMFLTTANQATQAKLLDEFNKEAAQIYKNSGGFPSMEEMQQIQAKKNFLISKQQEMKADMERYIADREAISRDINGNLDKDEFTQREQGYFGGGRYGESPLSASPLDAGLYLNRDVNKVQGTPTSEYKTIKIGGVDQKVTISKSATEPEARDYIGRLMVSNPRISKGIVKEIQQLKTTAPQEYIRIFDKTGDGVVDEFEAKEAGYVSNPIIKYAQDKYWQNAIKTDESKPSGLGTNRGNIDNRISVSLGGQQVELLPAEKRAVSLNYGGETRNNLYSFGGNKTLFDFPTEGAKVLWDTYSDPPMAGGSNIKAQLVDYDADKDKLIVRTVSGNDVLGYESGQLIEIDAKKVQDVDKLPLTLNGKTTNLGALRQGSTQTTVSKPTFIEWRKISGNEKKTFTDYNKEVHGR